MANPRVLEEQLNKAKEKLVEVTIDYNMGLANEDELEQAHFEVDELSDKVNFAWQDEEESENYTREMGYSKNPLDDIDWDEDDEDYFFDIPSNAF